MNSFIELETYFDKFSEISEISTLFKNIENDEKSLSIDELFKNTTEKIKETLRPYEEIIRNLTIAAEQSLGLKLKTKQNFYNFKHEFCNNQL